MSWHISPDPVNVGKLKSTTAGKLKISLERKRATEQLQGKKHRCCLLSTETYVYNKASQIKEQRWDI